MNATQATADPHALRSRRSVKSSFYVIVTLAMIALAVIGFWPQYYGRLLNGAALEARADHLLIHVHSVLFIGWLLALLTQTVLVVKERTDLHRWIGPFLAGYGIIIAIFGTYAGLALAARRVELGRPFDNAASFTFSALSDMVMFAGFLLAALVWRHRPEAHKRLMILATWSLALIGFGRLLGRVIEWPGNILVAALYMLAPLILVTGWDAVKTGRVHPVWIFGLVLYFLRAVRSLFANSDLWLPIGRALVRPFL